jgi:hypothetical protein
VRGFNTEETVFYTVCFVVASVACLLRVWNDRESGHTVSSLVGRCFTSGIYGFGIIALWLGRVADGAVGSGNPYVFIAVSAFVGMASRELQERVIVMVFRKVGLIKDQTN